MAYAIERLVDHAARELGIDPAVLRRKNLVPREAFPHKLPNGIAYDCGDFARVLDTALAASDWDGFAARRAAAAARGRLLGRGLSVYVEASGAGFVPKDQVEIRFGRDADGRLQVTLHAASHAHGQGHETAFAQVVGAVLGLPPERFRLVTAAAGTPQLTGNLTSGARSLAGTGSVFHMAALEVVRAGRTMAARALGCDEGDLAFADGAYRAGAHGRSVTLEALALAQPDGGDHPLSLAFESKFGSTFPNGCHAVEVEVDPDTGATTITRFVACDDIGNIVNHQIVEGQIHGGIAQGFGEVFGEAALYDAATGQLLSGSFLDYPMPRAGWVGGIEIHDAPLPTAANPLGVKGAGEAGTTGSLPALMNAVVDALHMRGVRRLDMPATPARVWKALEEASAGRAEAVAVQPLEPVELPTN
jgi:carbon-monoxide dehydrogenase large subunit